MSAEEYEKKIASYNRNDLITLWDAIKENNAPDWQAGKALEYLVLRAFQLEGAEVRWPYSVHYGKQEIEQIDGVIYLDYLICVIECKDQKEPVSVEPIAKLRNQLTRRPSSVFGVLFSRSGFTDPAITLAQFISTQTILIWNGDEISYALEKGYMKEGLIRKYRHHVEYGFIDYDIRVGG
ncbi:MAG: hypothetical protein BroJett018_14590 [Chloroflexota bacterium]|nr:hypothetical protein [Chloroflexota bacterium]NOG65179.1 hypothetical protein [Chloroflexota bacterium]GIK63665.1 MAG: hypothetical protein BroJett018_14590 [Chloroflexota bacterium]